MRPAGDGQQEDPLDDELAAQLGQLPACRPDEDFARDLRARFLAGTLGARGPRPRARRRWLWPLVGALAAGLLLGVFLFPRPASAPPVQGWRLLATPSARGVTLEGLPLDPARAAEFPSVLSTGGSLRNSQDGRVRLAFGQRFVHAGPYVLRAESGHLACSTGPDFADSRLLVVSPDSEVEVLGTRFAVDVDPSGTCVCCAVGEVAFRSLRAADAARELAPGDSAFAFPDGELAGEAIRPEHLETLRALEGFWE